MSQIGFDFSARTQSSIVFAVVVAVIVVVVVAGVALVVVLSTIAIVKLQGQFGYFYSFFCQNKKKFSTIQTQAYASNFPSRRY